jgi:hypothetical protein
MIEIVYISLDEWIEISSQILQLDPVTLAGVANSALDGGVVRPRSASGLRRKSADGVWRQLPQPAQQHSATTVTALLAGRRPTQALRCPRSAT